MSARWVDELFDLFRDPTTEALPVPWEQGRQQAGLEFPADYRRLVDRYGTFQIYQYLTVLGPTSGRPQGGMAEGFVGHKEFSRFEAVNALLPENYTEPSPDGELVVGPDSILHWGGNIGGSRFFWLVDGKPDDWPIAIWYRGGPWVIVRAGLAQFLVEVINRTSPEADYVIPVQGPANPDWTPGEPIPPLLTCLGGW